MGVHALFCAYWQCSCCFAHAQVCFESLMSMRNTCNMLAFAVFGGRLLALLRGFAIFCRPSVVHMRASAVLGVTHVILLMHRGKLNV
jgi:hypothetical protein